MMQRYKNLRMIPVWAVLMFVVSGCARVSAVSNNRALGGKPPAADMTVSAADYHLAADFTLGSFSTTFNPNNKNRSHNIARASEAIDSTVVQPGETFSYNETVGPTSRKDGYKLGTIFIKGRMYEGYGGGVCQVSSTLYNAAANAGMSIVERHDHSMPVPYVETGKDAATSYGGIDFKFKNELSFPVVINSYVDNGTVSVTISAV